MHDSAGYLFLPSRPAKPLPQILKAFADVYTELLANSVESSDGFGPAIMPFVADDPTKVCLTLNIEFDLKESNCQFRDEYKSDDGAVSATIEVRYRRERHATPHRSSPSSSPRRSLRR